ncbi:TPR domain-containing glycosyltransferase [Crassaminicella indica]|uniref:Glycosyltransferase n=1 Tax=Crassaminicella indica TaxID=2855394 RepID=A0ABX8RBB4_9CLOT|nr:TPR domain-containing glycosyltransferase [Crassaminicella indica]QXM06342.1 glycosyltransferase [Crassaminicella indica]
MLLSLCVIAKNEEKNLSRCLESAKNIVDEIIVVDTGSTDSTVKIAKSYGAKVFYYEWNDNFSEAKNFAFDQAKGDWILTMDADEELNSLDQNKVLPLLDNDDIDIYIFQTLSYIGNKPGLETASNLNIRLIRNNKGYYYKGAIHEQICNKNNPIIENSKVKIEKIIVYHYGYLKTVAKEKKKSDRNMQLLKKILKEDPNNHFHLFNIGNEYLRLEQFEKALEYYYKVYKKFTPKSAVTPKLLLRMILSLDALHKYDEEMEVINKGLCYYDKFTDLVYLKACLYHKQKKYSLAIKEFKKCLIMGEAPIDLCNMNDVGGYKASYALGEIYLELGDYDEAYNYYIKTIKAKPSFHIPLYRIAEILMKKEKKIDIVKLQLERFFEIPLNVEAYTKLGDIFFEKEEYDVALEYFLKAKDILKEDTRLNYYVGMSYLFMKDYKEAYSYFEKIKGGDYYKQAVYKMILCEILSNNIENTKRLFCTAKTFKDPYMYLIYKSFKNLVEEKVCSVISEDKEESKIFSDRIFMLLNVLIKIATPEIFEKSLQLLNLIDNDEVLLRLAKLYYSNRYYQLAYQEFIRSIKIFGRIDREGLEMMKNALDQSSLFTT